MAAEPSGIRLGRAHSFQDQLRGGGIGGEVTGTDKWLKLLKTAMSLWRAEVSPSTARYS
jgi:hypothetical protein